jgi:hypothetical protein
MRKGVRHVSFWLAVAGVSILANFGLELVTGQTNSPGLARFTAVTHKGAS